MPIFQGSKVFGRPLHFTIVIVINYWRQLRTWFECDLNEGFDNFRATALDAIYSQNGRRMEPVLPQGLAIRDILVRWPDEQSTSPLTQRNFEEWAEWYQRQADGKLKVLEVDLASEAEVEAEMVSRSWQDRLRPLEVLRPPK